MNNKRARDDDKIGNDWIAASKTRNTAVDDPCLDYYEMYNIYDINSKPIKKQRISEKSLQNSKVTKKVEPIESDNFMEYILKKGIQFEEEIVSKLQNKYGDNFIKICNSYEAIYKQKCEETIDAMKKGIPIIYQGIVQNPTKMLQDGDERTFGAVDLLVRSDWVNKIVNKSIMTASEIANPAPNLGTDYHYRVIDIKWTKLHFNVNFKTLRNNLNVKPFKTQLSVYNYALGYMQGYTPNCAYILGNGWMYEKTRRGNRTITKSANPFDRLGQVDFTEFDQHYNEKASEAIIWYRKLQNQTNFTHNPPNRPELYPNMNNSHDGKFHHVKEQIAEKYSEITQIWNCGIKEREKAFDRGVTSWKDQKFNTNLIGLRPGKKQKVIDTIVAVNRDGTELIYPKQLPQKYNWQEKDIVKIYVDFETIQENMTEIQLGGDFIFMIGVLFKKNDEVIYKCFCANELSLKSERVVIDNFFDLVSEISNEKENILFHWGHHENNVLKNAIKRHGNIWQMPKFHDFCRTMTDIPIIIKGAYCFGLKIIAKAMYKNKLIDTIWTDDIQDGVNAMYKAWKEYKKYKNNVELLDRSVVDSEMMQKIISYNKVDCQTMYEIIEKITLHYEYKGISININNILQETIMSSDSDNTEIENNVQERKTARKAPRKRLAHPPVSKSSDEEKPCKKSKKDKSSDEEWIPKKKKQNIMIQISEPVQESESDDTDNLDDFIDNDLVSEDLVDPVSEDLPSDEKDVDSDDEPDINLSVLEVLINKVFDSLGKKYGKEKMDDDVREKIKNTLLSRMVKVEEIYKLENTTDDEKANLFEKYISCATLTNVDDFIHDRDELRRQINNHQIVNSEEMIKLAEIKERLENCKENTVTLEKRILLLDVDDLSKKIIYNKYKQLASTHVGTDSHAKLKEWIENAIKIPYNIIKPIKSEDVSIVKYLNHVKTILDQELFGMQKAKEELLMILNNKLRDPTSLKNTLAFVGAPGTGKTAIVIALCKALGLPHSQISLGGKHDASYFLGHSYTYEGSRPGQIVTSLQQMGCKNGILFFDEFDKLEDREGKKGVSNLMLHITDFTQNSTFNDEYIAELSIDLSKIWFMFSLNDIEKVDPILRNRMTFIQVPGYSDEEKQVILREYVIPKCNKRFSFTKDNLIFTTEVIKHIIKKANKEEGVREIERNI